MNRRARHASQIPVSFSLLYYFSLYFYLAFVACFFLLASERQKSLRVVAAMEWAALPLLETWWNWYTLFVQIARKYKVELTRSRYMIHLRVVWGDWLLLSSSFLIAPIVSWKQSAIYRDERTLRHSWMSTVYWFDCRRRRRRRRQLYSGEKKYYFATTCLLRCFCMAMPTTNHSMSACKYVFLTPLMLQYVIFTHNKHIQPHSYLLLL